jgi:hypothetical protein
LDKFLARTNENDALGLRVIDKEFHAVEVVGPIEGIAANSDHSSLPETNLQRTLSIVSNPRFPHAHL